MTTELVHRQFTADKRKRLAKSGKAMPDGSFPIEHFGDLMSAIKLAKTDAARKHIIDRAKALGFSKSVPKTWNTDGSLKHSTLEQLGVDFLSHYGIKGMKWGVRKDTTVYNTASVVSPTGETSKVQIHPDSVKIHDVAPSARKEPSADATMAAIAKARAKSQSLDSLSNQELQHLVNRMNLEQQYTRLSAQPETISRGKAITKTLLKRLGPLGLVTALDSMAKSPVEKAAVTLLGKAMGTKPLKLK